MPVREVVRGLPIWEDPHRTIEIAVDEREESVSVEVAYEGRTYSSSASRFDDALHRAIAQLPGGVIPAICGACRYGLIHMFGQSTGRDDLSCFRDAKKLALDVEWHGKQATPEALAYFGTEIVGAFDGCPDFEPMPLNTPA